MKSSFIVTVEVGPDDPPVSAWEIQEAVIERMQPEVISVRPAPEDSRPPKSEVVDRYPHLPMPGADGQA